jgi:beta-galactosidase
MSKTTKEVLNQPKGPRLCALAWLAALCAACNLFPPQSACAAESAYVPPPSPRVNYNFNADWKFIRQDIPGAEQPAFDDSTWTTVSAPHTYNDVDSYTELISHSGGDRGAWTGITWYRKHFKLPASAKGEKVILEFEGLKQAAHFWVNGKPAGRFENGITACGLDLSDVVNFGDTGNVIAAKVDKSNDYKEEATGVGYECMGRAFNPNYGGLNHDIVLHIFGKAYQTLPLYENLQTTGTYIYANHCSKIRVAHFGPYPVLEITAKVEPFENGRGFSLRALRAGKPRT